MSEWKRIRPPGKTEQSSPKKRKLDVVDVVTCSSESDSESEVEELPYHVSVVNSLLGMSNSMDEPEFFKKPVQEIIKEESLTNANIKRLWADSYKSIETGKRIAEDTNDEEESKEDDTAWMDNDVIDLFAFLLTIGRESKLSHMTCEMCSPMVHETLLSCEQNGLGNLKYMQDQLSLIGHKKYTFWPVLSRDEHWVLIVFEKNEKGNRALFFDSLNRKQYYKDTLEKLEKLQQLSTVPEWVKNCKLENVTNIHDKKCHQHDGRNVPIHSCGAWVCLYMELLSNDINVSDMIKYLNTVRAGDAKIGIQHYEKLMQKRLLYFVREDETHLLNAVQTKRNASSSPVY
ncbi:hypothetical protein AKO1_014798 [Acrasis kona]|uniref:Ubiquitin-like protease family profile domain-containing protein n=1 Tax=Acrasis kona TaxID=1008807 RepID=A0AAW2Z2I2_9EUKA